MFTSPQALELSTTRLPVGQDVVQFKTSVDRDKLFVLSRGVTPRYKETDEARSCASSTAVLAAAARERVELQDPYNELEVDPQGEWLLVHGSDGLVSNPNELLLVRLGEDPARRPRSPARRWVATAVSRCASRSRASCRFPAPPSAAC